jgi:hypothetical protein
LLDEKEALLHTLRYFIEKQKTTATEYKAELERLDRASGELQKALQPFGKLPKEIIKVEREVEEELRELLRG